VNTKQLLAKAHHLAHLEDQIALRQMQMANPNGFLSDTGLAHLKQIISHAKKTALVLKRELAAMLS
jgi:hypothetical protein